jgi:alanyl aminopeptidase
MSKWQKFFAFSVVVSIGLFCFHIFSTVQQERHLTEKRSSPQGQLPDTITPLNYDLTLRIDPSESEFSGVVKIQIVIKKPVKEIWMHGKSIDADKVTITTSAGVIDLDYREMGRSGVVQLTAKQTMQPQTAMLEIHYHAPFDTKLSGLYKVEENDESYIFSQFEAIDARKAFPGFDEPRFKVPFALALEIRNDHKGFANTPQVKEQKLADNFKRLIFATTKPLPTYLLAFAVGDFDVVEYEAIAPNDIRQKFIPLRGISVKGKGNKMTYALENTAAILTTIEQYFGTPYPYEKLDLVAVPDFGAGAMENAGLITYREQLLLLGDEPTFAEQRAYASVHAHELAHQWFGNLVTMPWWDDIWLNEAFATWMASKAVHRWDPKFEFGRDMVRRGHWVMSQDALISARQVREPVPKNDFIDNAFDNITYQKGGAVLQMLERFIGAETFQKGVVHHMKRFAYGHADAYDFIESMAQVSDKKGLKDVFFSFLTQPGVPSIELDWSCGAHLTKVTVKQQRYLPLGSSGDPKQQWDLPVCLTLITDNGVDKSAQSSICQIITQEQQTIEIQGQCPLAIMPNNEGSGYYRFEFSQAQWQNLMPHLDKFSASEKYALANNLAAAFRAGDIDASYYVKAVKPFAQQQQWDLITAPAKELQFINNYIADPAEQEQLTVYLDILYRPLLNRLGLHNNTESDRSNPVATSLLRRNIVNFMALRVKEPNLREVLLASGKAYIGYQTDNHLDETVINEDLATAALSVAVAELGRPYFDALKQMIDDSSNSSFRQRGLRALGSTIDPQLAEDVRSMTLSLSIKNSERRYLLDSQMLHRENQSALFEWLKSYFTVLETVLPQRVLAFTPIVGRGFCTLEKALDVEMFFNQKTAHIPGAKRNLAMTLEQIRLCVALKSNQHGIVFEDKNAL